MWFQALGLGVITEPLERREVEVEQRAQQQMQWPVHFSHHSVPVSRLEVR